MEWINFKRMDEWEERSRWFREQERSEGGLPAMTQPDFLAALERHLQLHGVPFTRADVQAFVESCWPLIEDDPRAEKWCSEFLAALPAAPSGSLAAILRKLSECDDPLVSDWARRLQRGESASSANARPDAPE